MNEQIQEKSFMKKLFGWRYIVPLVLLQSGLLYIILMAPGDMYGLGLLAFAVIFFLSDASKWITGANLALGGIQ